MDERRETDLGDLFWLTFVFVLVTGTVEGVCAIAEVILV